MVAENRASPGRKAVVVAERVDMRRLAGVWGGAKLEYTVMPKKPNRYSYLVR